MAVSNSPYLKNYRGNLRKTVVVKQAHKTIVTGYPDMRRVKYNKAQRTAQSRFAEAVAYARSVINDPVKKAIYSKLLPKGKRLYNAALQEFLDPQPVPFSTIKPPVKKRGRMEENVIIKNYGDRYVITAPPDMSRVMYNEKQKQEQTRFARAVAYARSVIMDPEKKAALQKRLPKGKKAYHAALQQYLDGTCQGTDSGQIW